ncbi:MAG: NAD(P)/FAD-dependent oxidoreductase [Collinsella sp.]|nr:NAD(P)/FAD-dependent oxidoreductase [Collinsella sp.]
MIEVSDIRIPLGKAGSEEALAAAARRGAARVLGVREARIAQTELHRVSIDARKKADVHLTAAVRIGLADPAAERRALASVSSRDARRVRALEPEVPAWPRARAASPRRSPVVVGAGCAGLFAALALAEAGLEPLLIERGDDARRRTAAVERFNATGELDPESNIQFGLGGAGTFSDGKLTTGTKNPAHRLILETLVAAGAPREILWDAKPHVGSDILPAVVTHIVSRIRELGGEVRFRCRLTDIERDAAGAVNGIRVQEGADPEELIACRDLVLACGHSARDVFVLLKRRGIELARKTFAMGARVEHLQSEVDRAQYGPAAGHPALGAAPYKLVAHTDADRSLFTFCMCPGGEVVAAASEPGGAVTNGASLHARAGENANAALLVNVNPTDLPGDDILAGVDLQRACERRAFELGGGAYRAPAQLVGDFLADRASAGAGSVAPTYPRGVAWGRIDETLPSHVADAMRRGIPLLARRLRAFEAEDAVLTGVESRSSSPVTVVRDRTCVSVGAPGLYPCGEGAGYAGGIMSAATDGIRVATAIVEGR